MFPLKFRAILAIPLIAGMVGCGGGNSSNNITQTPVTISISPTSATLSSAGTQSFAATVQGAADTEVIWFVQPVSGSNATTGTVSSVGLYTAPTVQSTMVFTVTAVAAANTSITASASVTVTPIVSVTVTPHSASIATNHNQQFGSTVTNTSNTAVTWEVNGMAGGSSAAGFITASGLYTAPNSVPAQNLVTVTAISVADNTKSDSASVTITLTPVVTVNVNPTQANVVVGNTQAFSATVTGTSNTAVTWSISGGGCSGGGSPCGSIDSSGLYTAPAIVPAPSAVTITATSQADSTKSATAAVTVIAALGVQISPAGPLSVALGGTQMFTATVFGDSTQMSQGVSWTLICTNDAEGSGFHDCAQGGTSDDGGLDISSLSSMNITSATFQAAVGETPGSHCDEGFPCTLTLTATTIATDGHGTPATATVTITVP